MKKSCLTAIVLVSIILCLLPDITEAQQRHPNIGYIYPTGGRQGHTFNVTIGGQYLRGATNVYISGKGVSATIERHIKPLGNQERNAIRAEIKKTAAMRRELQKKGEKPGGEDMPELPLDARDVDPTELSLKGIATYQKMLVKPPFDQQNAQLAEKVILRVKMDSDADPGEHELRLLTPTGTSKPMVFCVNSLPEYLEEEPNNKKPAGTALELPVVVNGQILPHDIDRFRFKGRKGLNLVVAVQARSLVPFMADAVPGWFQATMALYNAKGEELAFVDDYRFDPDPVLLFKIPEDGEYDLEIRDSIYRGREDFVYRISLGELPFVASVFPLGGQAGKQTQLHVTGWNLPGNRITLDNRDRKPGTYSVTMSKNGKTSRPHPVAAGELTEMTEQEPNNAPGQAQAVPSAITVNGHINAPGDWDVFRVKGKAGDKIVAEVHARRLNSPVDSILRVTDSKGKIIASNDDHVDKSQGLATHHADSYLITELPSDGTCYVHLGDIQNSGGRAYAYRLRLSKPQPDFVLRAVPSSLNLRRNETRVLTVHALRRDGFEGDIKLELGSNPKGFKLSGGLIPADMDSVRITVTAPPSEFRDPVELTIRGAGKADGKWIKHDAVPADDVMQAFLWRHLVAAEKLSVVVQPKWAPPPLKLLENDTVKFRAGRQAELRFRTVNQKKRGKQGNIKFELSDPPEGFEIEKVSKVKDGFDIIIATDPEKVTPGTKGNLVLSAFREVTPKGKDGKARAKRRQPMGVLPAVPFEVTPTLSGTPWPPKKTQSPSA
jgi:hypothetical protein